MLVYSYHFPQFPIPYQFNMVESIKENGILNPVIVLKKETGEAGYEIVKVKGVDMFANTYHCETVALLSKLN